MRRVNLLLCHSLLTLSSVACSDKEEGEGSEPDVNAPPTIEMGANAEHARFYSDVPVSFSGTASDSEDASEALTMAAESDRDGLLSLSLALGSDGTVVGQGLLSEGIHAVSFTVVDSEGEEGVSIVNIDVGPPNVVPSCELVEPIDGSAAPAGSDLTVAALATDSDLEATDLNVTIESDVDGILYEGAPDSDGSVRFNTNSLSTATHVLTLVVTDELGASCMASVTYTAGDAPEVEIATPESGSTVNEGEEVTFLATVSDLEDAPTDIALVWISDVDGELSTAGADSSGEALLRTSSLTTGSHRVQLEATDSDGLRTIDSIDIVINARPTTPELSLTPDPAYTEDELTATATGSTDPDSSGDITYGYAWYEDGVLSTVSTDAVFPASSTTKGREYRVVVTPSDGLGDGAAAEASVVIDNTAPVLTGPSLTSSTVSVGDTLTCASSATDADEDVPFLSYSWSNGASGENLVVAESDNPGDVLTCTATADDGDGGVTTGTASATVLNTEPIITGASVSPATAQVGETLTCTGTATDADGESPSISYAWSDGSTGSSYTLMSGDDPGDTITCTVTASDTDGGSVSATASASVINTDPVLDSLSITPDPATNDDSLTCVATTSDADGDLPTETYSWSGSISGALGSGATLDLSTTTVESGETVTCMVELSDPDGGTASGSSTLEVDNRDPDIIVSVAPASDATIDSTLVCTATASDLDDDSVSVSFGWTVDGTSVAASSTSALSTSLEGAFVAGETVICTGDADDGKGGTTTSTASVIIENTPPVVSAVSLSSSTAYTNDTLTALATVTDADGDSPTLTYDFYVGGTLVQSGSDASLDGASSSAGFDKGDSVTVTVTADDGDDSDSGTSSATLILNTPPEAPSVAVTPTDPSSGDELICEVLVAGSDADGDVVTYSMEWMVDGGVYTSGGGFTGPTTTDWDGDTVSAADLASGQAWDCVATPADDEEAGDSAGASADVCDFDGDGVTSELGSCGGSDCDDDDGLVSSLVHSFDMNNTIDGHVELTTTENAYNITNAYSVTAWVNVASYPTSWYVLLDMERFNSNSTYSDNVGMYVLLDSNLRLVTDFGDGSSWNAFAPATAGGLSTNTWAHVGVTRSGSTVKYYVDGVEVDSVTVSSANIDWSGSSIREDDRTRIGMDFKKNFSGVEDSSLYFDGRIGDVGIWNRALTASEIGLTMDGYPTGTATTDLQAFWTAESGDMVDATGTHGTGTAGSGATADEECIP